MLLLQFMIFLFLPYLGICSFQLKAPEFDKASERRESSENFLSTEHVSDSELAQTRPGPPEKRLVLWGRTQAKRELSSGMSISQNIPILDPQDPQFFWMDKLIEQDFARVSQNISIQNYQEAIQIHISNSWIIRLRVIDNQVQGPSCPCRTMLEYLCKTYGLPNVDFLYWNNDGAWDSPSGKVPILMGARSNKVGNTLLFCDWIFDIENLNANRGWHAERQIIDAQYPLIQWESREAKLFWRGAGTDVWSAGSYSIKNWANHARGRACYLSTIFPEFIDAAFTGFHPWNCENGDETIAALQQIVPFSPYVSLKDHLKYKYHLQISGVMASFPRDRWQFYSESVVFRTPHPHEMYWYDLLEPWKHYIPVETSMNDLLAKIKWARAHDHECHRIAKAARHFAQTHFMPEHIALYCYKVLLRYSQIQKF